MHNKPIRGSILNKAHPLARNLDAAFLFNEYGGTEIYDLIVRKKGTLQAEAEWRGEGVFLDGVNDYISTDWTPNAAKGTIALWLIPYNRTNSIRYWCAGPTSAQLELLAYNNTWNFYGNGWDLYNVATINLNVLTFVACTWNTTSGIGAKLYIDGKFIQGDTAISTPTVTVLYLGRFIYTATAFSSAKHILCYGYNTDLSQDMIAWLARDKYGMFKEVNKAKYFFIPAVGGLSIPVAMADYRQMRS